MSRIELIILIVIIVIALPLLISFFDIQVTVGKTYGLENIGFPNVDIITWVENHPETVALIGVLIPIAYTLVNSFIKRRADS